MPRSAPRRLLFLAALAALLLPFGAGVATALPVGEDGPVSCDPADPDPGTSTTCTAEGLEPESDFTWMADFADGSTSDGFGAADTSGAGEFTVDVPDAEGDYTVTVTGTGEDGQEYEESHAGTVGGGSGSPLPSDEGSQSECPEESSSEDPGAGSGEEPSEGGSDSEGEESLPLLPSDEEPREGESEQPSEEPSDDAACEESGVSAGGEAGGEADSGTVQAAPAGTTPQGGVATGAGGTADGNGNGGVIVVVVGLVLAGLLGYGFHRRRSRAEDTGVDTS